MGLAPDGLPWLSGGVPIRRCIIESSTATHSFLIKTGQNTEQVNGRKRAIEQAKAISSRTWRPVGIERDDGRVKMQFSRGSLQTYRFDTHDRR